MVGRRRLGISESLACGRGRFEAWRRSRTVGDRIPDQLWSLAVKLAAVHGLSRTAAALRVDYYSLRARVAARSSEPGPVAPAFIELSPPPLAPSTECVVEFEDGSGARMRVHLRGGVVPDLVALGRSFWSGE